MRNLMTTIALCISFPAFAESEQPYPVSELYVVSVESVQLKDQTLVLSGLNSKVIWFTDRPQRQSGVADTEVFIANWPMGDDSFEVDPPNAVLVGSNPEGEEVEFPMELMRPGWKDSKLTLHVLPLSESLPSSLSLTEAHLFIDNAPDEGEDPSGTAWCGHECFSPVIGRISSD